VRHREFDCGGFCIAAAGRTSIHTALTTTLLWHCGGRGSGVSWAGGAASALVVRLCLVVGFAFLGVVSVTCESEDWLNEIPNDARLPLGELLPPLTRNEALVEAARC